MSKPVRMQTALKWAFVMSWGPSAIAAVVTLVLLLYLSPADYGLVAIAGLYISFNKIFLEGGLGAALVQRKDLEREHLDAVFWITLLLSLFLMALSWVLAPLWAAANQDADMVNKILRFLSVVMPIQGLTVVQESLLKREMDFKSLAIRSNVSALVGGVFGLSLATQGFGVWALVGEDLLGAGVRFVLLWQMGKWRPRLAFSWRHLKELFGFSVYVMFGQIGTFVQRRSDSLLIGLFFGPAAVGIYRMADRLINMLIEMTTRPFVMVVLPQFSRVQDDVAALRKSVKDSLAASAMLTIPLLAILAGLSYLICDTLSSKGKNWLDATLVIQILALTGAARAVTLFAGPLVQSVGRPRLFMTLNWSLAALNTVGFCIAGWWLGGRGDVEAQAVGVASARAFVFCLIYTPICVWIMARTCKVGVGQMLRSTVTACVVSAAVFAVGFMIDHTLRHVGATLLWQKAALLIVGGGVTSGLAVFLMFRLDPNVREFILKRLRRRKGPQRGFEVSPAVDASQVPANP